MKSHQIIFLGLIFFAVVSCKLSGESNTTPQISFYSKPIVNGSDSLSIYYAGNDNYDYITDTISTGDAVTFKFILNAYYNNLVEFDIIRSDTTSSKIVLPDDSSMDAVFVKANSDYSQGKFVFIANQSYAYFPFTYLATAPSTSSIIRFYLKSDASFGSSSGSNYVSFRLKIPIVAKK